MPDEAEDIKDTTDVVLQKSETQGGPDDKAVPSLPMIAPIPVETNVHEEIHKEAESAEKDTNERQRPDNDFDENMKALEVLDVHEAEETVNTSIENEKKAQLQYQEKRQEETLVIKHLDLEGMDAAETILSNDTGEILEIMDGGNIKHEEAKKMGEETDAQLQKNAKESEPADEATSILPKLVIIEQGEMDGKSFQNETHEEEESTALVNDQRSRPQNEREQMSKGLEAIDVPQTMGIDAAENEHADSDSQLEAPSVENVITKHSNSEENMTMKGSEKSSYDVEELERIRESHLVHNTKIKYGEQEKALDIKEANELKLRKSETESVPGEKALTTLHPTASVSVETVEQSIKQEIHREVESAVTDTKDGLRPEKDLEEKKNVIEAFGLDKATGNTSHENGMKPEIQTEVKNLDTTVIKHLNLEGETLEVNTSNDTEDCEQVPMPHTKEEIEIKESMKCIQEKVKDMEEGTEDEAMPTTNDKAETVEDIFQDQNLKEDQPAATDINNSNQPEYKLEQTADVVEAIDQPETTANISEQNGQHVEHQSKASATEIIIAEHINEETKATLERSTKSSNDVNEVEKTPELHSVSNSEIMDGSELSEDEATDIKEATNVEIQQHVAEDIVFSNLHPTAAVDRVEDNIQQVHSEEEIHEREALSKFLISEIVKDEKVQKIVKQQTLQEEKTAAIAIAKSCMPENEPQKIANTDEQRPEKDPEEKKNVIEATDLREAAGHTSHENDKKAEIQSEMQILDTIVIKHLNLEGETSEVKTSNDTNDREQVPTPYTKEEIEIKESRKSIREEINDMEEATEDKALPRMLTLSNVKVETTEIFQEQNLEEEESAVTDVNKSNQLEYELEQRVDVVEAIDQPETMANISEQNEHVEHQSKPSATEVIIPEHINEERNVTSDRSTKSSNDVNEMEMTPELNSVSNSEIMDGSELSADEATDINEATNVEIQQCKIENVAEDIVLSNLHPTAAVERLEDSIQEVHLEEEIHEHDALSKLLVSEIVKDEKVQEIIKQQTLQGGKTAEIAITKSFMPENEPEKIANTDGQRPEKDPEEKKNVIEAIDLHEATGHTSHENEKKTEIQFEVQILDTIVIKHLNLKGETSEVKTSNDTNDREQVPMPHTKEEIEIKESRKCIQEKVKDMEEVTEDEAQLRMLTLSKVKVETADIFQEQNLKEEESPGIDVNNSNQLEYELEQRVDVDEAINQPETAANISEQNEHVEHQSKASATEIIIAKHINEETNVTSEISTKSSNDVNEVEKTLVLHSVSSFEIMDGCELSGNEATDIKEATNVEIQQHKIENVAKDIALSTLNPTAAVDRVEDKIQEEHSEVGIPEDEGQSRLLISKMDKDENVQEILKQQTLQEEQTEATDITKICKPENELGKMANTDGQRPEKNLEEKKNVIEAIDLHEATGHTTHENEKIAEIQTDVKNLDTIVIKHLNLDGDPLEVNTSNDTEGCEQDPMPHTKEEIEIKESMKCIQEEVKEVRDMEEAAEIEAMLTMLTFPNVNVETVEEIFQEQNLNEEESAAMDINNSYQQEYELEQTADVFEAIDQPETMANVRAQNEQEVEHQSKASTTEIIIAKHINEERKGTSKISTKSSYDVIEVEKTSELRSVGNSKIMDGSKLSADEGTNIKDATNVEIQQFKIENVVEDIALSNLHPTTAAERDEVNIQEVHSEEEIPEHEVQSKLFISEIVKNEKVQEILKQRTLQEEKTAAIAITKSCRPENEPEKMANIDGQQPEKDLAEKKNVIEAFGLHEAIGNPSQENGKKDEIQTEVQNLDTIVIKQLSLEGETLEVKMSNDTKDCEQVAMPHTKEEIEIKESMKCIQEEVKDKEEVTKDEALPTMLTFSNVKVETVEEIFQEQNLNEEESAATDINKSSQQKYELEQTTNVVESIDIPETMANISAQNEQHAEHQSKASATEIIIAEHINEERKVTSERNTKSSYDVNEVEKTPVLHSVSNFEIMDGCELSEDEATDVKEATNVEIQQCKIENVAEDIALSNSDPTAAVYRVEDKIQKLHSEEEIPEDEAQSKLLISEIAKDEKVQEIVKQQTLQEEETAAIAIAKSCRPENEPEKIAIIDEATNQPETMAKVGVENEERANHQSVASRVESVPTKYIDVEGKVTSASTSKSSYDIDKLEKTPESHLVANSEIKHGSKITQEEATDIKELTDVGLQESEEESVSEDKVVSNLSKTAAVRVKTVAESIEEKLHMEAESEVKDTIDNLKIKDAGVPEDISTITSIKDMTFKKSIQEEIYKEAESSVTDTKEGKRPENEFEENTKVIEAFDQEAGYACTENEKKADIQYEAQSQENMVIKHLNLEGLETEEISPINDTNELGKEYKVTRPGDVSELQSADVMWACVNEGIPMLKDRPMLSDQNASDISKLSAYNHHKLDSENKEKPAIVACGCAATSTPKNMETIEGQENSKTTFEDSQTGVAIERVTTELETGDCSHEQITTDDTPAEMIPESPYPCKNLEPFFDFEAHNQTNEQLLKAKEKSNKTLDQISESDDHIQGQKFKHENQINPEPQMESEHHFITPLNVKPISAASLITEVHDKVDRAGRNENTKEQTTNSGESLSEIQVPFQKTVNQVKHHDNNNSNATDSKEKIVITHQSFENDPTRKEATSRDSDEAIKQAATGILETQEAEITQVGSEKEDEFEKISPSFSDSTVIVKGSRGSHKNSHGILSGVGSKVKHSISKVKKAITGKSSQLKTQSPK